VTKAIKETQDQADAEKAKTAKANDEQRAVDAQMDVWRNAHPQASADDSARQMAALHADYKRAAKPMTAADIKDQRQADEARSLLDSADQTAQTIQKTVAAVGAAGKLGRGMETIGQILGATDENTRNRIAWGINTMRQFGGRMMNDRSILTARDQQALADILPGLEFGSTPTKTLEAMSNFQALLAEKYAGSMRRWAPEGETAKTPPAQNTAPGTPSTGGQSFTQGQILMIKGQRYRVVGGTPTDPDLAPVQ
jgi:hypothetical protein